MVCSVFALMGNSGENSLVMVHCIPFDVIKYHLLRAAKYSIGHAEWVGQKDIASTVCTLLLMIIRLAWHGCWIDACLDVWSSLLPVREVLISEVFYVAWTVTICFKSRSSRVRNIAPSNRDLHRFSSFLVISLRLSFRFSSFLFVSLRFSLFLFVSLCFSLLLFVALLSLNFS